MAGLVLASFTNAVASPESLLALVDVDTGYLRRVAFGYELADFGATGMCRGPAGDVFVALPGSCRIVRLSPSLEVTSQFGDGALADVHSLVWAGDRLLAVATGRDAIVELRTMPGRLEAGPAHHLSESGTDTLHVNSACVHNDRVLVSTFGANWRNHPVGAPRGEIIDLASREPVSVGLRHPHTLCSADGDLYVLGSYTGTVERVGSAGRRHCVASHSGYLRGLAFGDHGALVGVSARRRRSRGLGTVNAPGDHFSDRSGILRFDLHWNVVGFVDLTWFGSEIFDLLWLPTATDTPSIEDSFAAAKHRSLQLDRSWEPPSGGPVPPTAPIRE